MTQEDAKKLLNIENFRSRQEDCIDEILAGRDVFGIMPTGTGKSACFQIPGLMMDGTVIVVSPLLSLIRDQVDDLSDKGICAVSLSGRRLYAPTIFDEDGEESEERAYELVSEHRREIKFLYTTPETLRTRQSFFTSLKVPLIVVDEAHCVSGWGMDFRPAYRVLHEFIGAFQKRPVVAAFTATADSEVVEETIRMLGLCITPDRCIYGENPDIPAPIRRVELCGSKRSKDSKLTGFAKKHAGQKGIIFCSTKAEIGVVLPLLEKDWAKELGIRPGVYYGGVETDEAMDARNDVQQKFANGEINVVVATSAFGMGVNIRDVRYVLHYSFPYTMTDYLQQCGRAGRDGNGAECLLLASPEDVGTALSTINGRSLLPYSMQRSIAIRKSNWEKLLELIENCLEGSEARVADLYRGELEKLEKKQSPEEDWRQHGYKFLVINFSGKRHDSMRSGELSFADAMLVDYVFSIWYNGGASFTLRQIACLISGNPGFVFHGGSRSEKKEQLRSRIESLMARDLLPIEPRPGSRRDEYIFTEPAKENLPWAFPLQDAALYEGFMYPILFEFAAPIRERSTKGRRGELKQTTDYVLIRHYILRETVRMRSSGTSRRIIYSRGTHRKGETERAGLLHIYRFFSESMTPSNRKKKERYVHECARRALEDLVQRQYIGGYEELYAADDPYQSDPRDGEGISIGGRMVRGFAIKV